MDREPELRCPFHLDRLMPCVQCESELQAARRAAAVREAEAKARRRY